MLSDGNCAARPSIEPVALRPYDDQRLRLFIAATFGCLIVADGLWLPHSTIRIDPSALADYMAVFLPMAVIWAACAAMRYQLRKMKFRYRDLLDTIARGAQFFLAALAVTVLLTTGIALLSYFGSATNRPLMDAYLAAADAALGFDWVEFTALLNTNPLITRILSSAYFSLTIQMLVLPAILVLASRRDRLVEFISLYGLAGFITCLVMIIVPAAGAVHFYHPPIEMLNSFSDGAGTRHLEQLFALRSMNPFIIKEIEGLVTFPSFHAALGVLFIYSVRGIRFAAPPIYVLNGIMIVATIPEGAHYLVDVLAGAAVAVLSILFVRGLQRFSRTERAIPALG